MSHYAIIKANRKDIEWYFNNNKKTIDFIKEIAIEEENRDRRYSWYGISYKEKWEDEIKNYKLIKKYYDTGTYTEWEGSVNLDILQTGVFIYVPTLNEYHQVAKVEVNPNGEVTYYIDHSKKFIENGESSRIKAVEKWFAEEYPMYDSYDKLIKHKDDINLLQADYDNYVSSKNKEKELRKELKEKYNYEKPITLTDSSKEDKKSWWDRLFK